MTWLLALSIASAADCAHAPSEISSVADEALLAFAVMDEDSFERSADRALGMVACLNAPSTPQLAAALHRLHGIRQLVAGDDTRARHAFIAAVTTDPSYALSDVVAPAGGKLADAYTAARTAPAHPRQPLTTPGLVDGKGAADHPAVGPYLFQLTTPTGGVAHSAYVVDSAPVIPAGHTPAPPVAVTPMPSSELPYAQTPAVASTATRPASSGGGGKKGLLYAGLASGGAATALYGTAVGARLAYDGNPTNGAYTATNASYYGAIGTAVISGALLSTFLITK